MRANIPNFICLLSIALVLITSIGCVQVNKENTTQIRNESTVVKLGNVQSVNAQITMGAGMLRVAGGARDLLDANFVYNVASWKPEVTYSKVEYVGNLVVQQPSSKSLPQGNAQYVWDLMLNDDIPTNLNVTLGAGQGTLNVGDMYLTGLKVQSGAGNLTVDLSGSKRSSLNGSIQSGVGNLILRLPKDVGSKVDVSHGIGDVTASNDFSRVSGAYINNAYGKGGPTLNLSVELGIGKTMLESA